MPDQMMIEPVREKGEPRLPATGILCLNPGDYRYLERSGPARSGQRHFLFNSNLLTISDGSGEGRGFVAGPAVGAPMAAMVLEKLIALGACRIVVWGWCGSLKPDLGVGDILLADGGISGEGTSRYYPTGTKAASSPALMADVREFLAGQGMICRQGPVWTTDALYRESRSQLRELAEKGLLAVDMEYHALAAVSAFRQVDLAVALIVSDELWTEEWQPGFSTRDFKESNRRTLDLLLEMVLD